MTDDEFARRALRAMWLKALMALSSQFAALALARERQG